MKNKIFLVLTILIIPFLVFSQSVILQSINNINWQKAQTWYIGDFNKKVVSFEGATYPTDNQLPYFNKRIAIDKNYGYDVSIDNCSYIEITPEEKSLLSTSFSDKAQLSTQILNERGNSYLDINILPFITQENRTLKLKSFELKIIKTASAQKASASTRHSYATKSVLSNGKFVKIKIVNSGIYKLTYEDLSSMGITPANVRIFGYGGAMLDQSFLSAKNDDLPEIAIHMEKGSDGIFNAGDYVLFYAQGIQKWAYDSSKEMFTHMINIYSNYGYYFVTSDAGIAKKIELKNIDVPSNSTVTSIEEFVDYKVYENDLYTIARSGKELYGEMFGEKLSYDFSFSFPNPVTTSSTKVRLDVASTATVNTTLNLSLNGAQQKTLSISKRNEGDNYEKAKAANATYIFTPDNDNFKFNLTYNKVITSSKAYLNYIEVNARRQLTMSGSEMQFQNVDNLGKDYYNQYKVSNANNNVRIWDITDPVNISQVPTLTIDSKLTFTAPSSTLTSYIAVDPSASNAFPKPSIEGVVPNQNLHGLAPVDMVILTHPNFLSQAEKLAEAHRSIDKLTVAVVTTDQVYNEFSSGAPDATAYRWVMKMLYDRALDSGNADDMPKYLLLFGKGTFDNRKITNYAGQNYILTYQAENSLTITLSYVTDDYFAFLDDNEGTQVPTHLMDIGVGRFPVSTVAEATDVVDKTIGYMNNTIKGNWKNQLCYLADDGDAALHMRQADSIASMVSRLYPEYQINKIYLDSYLQEITASGEAYPLARTQFHDLIKSGLFLLDYTGHAGPTGWTNEQILSVADVIALTNKQLPLWVGATCDFLEFDGTSTSAGEHVVLNPYGGGIGILSAARPVYASQNFNVNRLVSQNLFKTVNGENYRIGDVIALAKNNIGSEINKLSYVYMGDPAVKLNYPSNYKIITTSINDNNTQGNDTLRAMSVVKVSGMIADNNGNKATGFNGEIIATVYDKVQSITTLNNEGDGTLTYKNRTNILFSGTANVVAGEFSVSFMIPKDIKYNYGGGRINYYATNPTTSEEAQGCYENFIVGGSNPNFVNETDGPEMNIFLNSESFVTGDQVNETPFFIAKLSDINGINRVGSGIGHDLLLTIDQDPNQSIVLNAYYEAVADKYTEGIVKYKMPKLSDGKHTLTFKAWDLVNNSSTKSIDFEVITGLTPNIYSISNYPNPVKTNTKIVVNHNRPETVLQTTVDIFDLSGRKIWTFSQSNADEINWDLIGFDGKKVKAGIYLYRVSINTLDSDVYSKTNKMLIIE